MAGIRDLVRDLPAIVMEKLIKSAALGQAVLLVTQARHQQTATQQNCSRKPPKPGIQTTTIAQNDEIDNV